jgi:magnesium transporter
MRPALQVPAPSLTLLKFLKSQSESICFFSPNPRPGFTFDHAAPRSSHSRLPITTDYIRPYARSISTTAPRGATVEAGFLNLEFLFPHSVTSTPHPESTTSRGTPRHKRRGYQGALFSRHNSTGAKKWHQKLWGMRSMKGGKPLRPDDLPSLLNGRDEGSDTSMFSLGRHISAKAAAQPKLRCTELDENGNVVLASGEFKKSELIQKVCPANSPLHFQFLIYLFCSTDSYLGI